MHKKSRIHNFDASESTQDRAEQISTVREGAYVLVLINNSLIAIVCKGHIST